MQAKTSMTLIMALALTAPMALRADDTISAATTTSATADAASSTPAAAAVATPVAANDAPGSITPGNKLNDDGKYKEAAAYFEGIGEQKSSNGHTKREPWRLNGWANAEIGLGDFGQAADLAQKSLDIDSTSMSARVAWNLLGSAQAQEGKRADAIATYNKGIAALKAAGQDTAKLEANLAPLKDAQDKADIKAGKVPASTSPTAAADASADTNAAAASSVSASAK
jgi:tetratricopeptide (TPR) repeat protein